MSVEIYPSTSSPCGKPLLDVLRGHTTKRRPIWMMRQAGRYLPEYRKVRADAGSFLDLCASPGLASDVTLQPISRFELDAAIIFADILLLPKALGQRLEFQEGEGPVLEPITGLDGVNRLSDQHVLSDLSPVFEALGLVSGKLPDDVTLIGFCGAPWTVATYMVAGRGTPDQRPAREAAYKAEPWFTAMIDLLVRTSIDYLCAQVRAGAEVLQIFDTWAGVLSDEQYGRWSVAPVAEIVRGVKDKHPEVPIIGFPRGSGQRYARYVAETGVDAIGIDWSVPLDWAREQLQSRVTVQGNLDPVLLATGGDALDLGVQHILDGLDRRGHIFNLGHGILPDTPIAHVERLISKVRAWDDEHDAVSKSD